jgi:hypothetical protein
MSRGKCKSGQQGQNGKLFHETQLHNAREGLRL